MAVGQATHTVELVRKKAEARGGDILFLISSSEIVAAEDRALYKACLVLHASDLPKGRGWSPHIWEISRGAESITLSLLEAEDKVDTGRLWKKIYIPVPRYMLWNEINHLLFTAEVDLIKFAIDHFDTVEPIPQSTELEPTYYSRRAPDNSKIDPNKSIVDQFDLLRVCDPIRFPAFFEHLGHRYVLKIERIDEK